MKTLMERTVKVGKKYRHFKGKTYKVLLVALDSESDKTLPPRKIVIYEALYGDNLVWARDYDMFLSEVDHKKYPEITQKYRFEEIDD